MCPDASGYETGETVAIAMILKMVKKIDPTLAA